MAGSPMHGGPSDRSQLLPRQHSPPVRRPATCFPILQPRSPMKRLPPAGAAAPSPRHKSPAGLSPPHVRPPPPSPRRSSRQKADSAENVRGREDRSPARPRGTAILSATVAGGAVGDPLLGMMGFAFTASLVLLLVASPFLVVFGPLLLPAALLLAATLAGFGAAAAMAVAGGALLSCAARAVGLKSQGPVGRFVETLTESGQRVKQQGVDMGEYLQRKALVQPPEGMEGEDRSPARPRGTVILSATVAGGAVGVPLLVMMGFAFTASLVLLLVASPFLVVFSPLLLPAALLLAASVAGFGAAAAMAVAGVAALSCAARAVGLRIEGPVGWFMETLTESGQRVKQQGVGMGDYKKALVQPPESRANQG